MIKDVTKTSFTFEVVSSGYFDPVGSTITFSTHDRNGQIVLRESANAPRANPLINVVAPSLAADTWGTLGDNLSAATGGGDFPSPPAGDAPGAH